MQELYELLKARQLRAGDADPNTATSDSAIRFLQDLYEPFYGGRQFDISIRTA